MVSAAILLTPLPKSEIPDGFPTFNVAPKRAMHKRQLVSTGVQNSGFESQNVGAGWVSLSYFPGAVR